LSRIKANESLADQALLIFEAQVDFIVRLKDILIDELIHRMGWIPRSKDDNRQKIENRILTNNFSEAEITHHHTTAQVLLDLCRGERKWEFLTEEERKSLTKNRLIQDMRAQKQYLKAVLTQKLISYIRKGKITFAHSFKYQDIGKVIESIELSDTDWMVTQGDIEKLI
jgi:bacillopeptidase F (M6 metalloprotease family)